MIRLKLTPDQIEQLTPLVSEAASNRENVLLVAAMVPQWSPQEGKTVWELQVVTLPAKLGGKIVKLIRDSKVSARSPSCV